MINSYTKLGGRYMKANKRRTIYTLIGIILSVALITSIGLFLKGIEKAEIETTQRSYGSFHLMVKYPSDDIYNRIAGNPKVKKIGLVNTYTLGNLNESIKAFGYIANTEAMDLMPYHIKEGRLPASENEIALEDWALRFIGKDIKAGTNVKIDGRSYFLSGTLENSIENQNNKNAVILSYSKTIDLKKSMMLVEFKKSNSLRKTIDGIEKKLPVGSYGENTMLLVWMGAGGDMAGMAGMYMVLAIIIGIVFIATVAMIYNAFQISVVERMKQFGLLRAVGATPSQIRNLVYKEASLLALIGIPMGLAMGIVAIYCIAFVFRIIGGDSVEVMKPGISLGVLGLSGVVSILAIYCSALLPAFHAGKISPLVAISSRAYIRKEKSKKTKVFLLDKLFGANGTMAAKNIKRNTKRYRITVFSIIISIVLFVTFKSFMDMSLNVSSVINESDNIHLSITRTEIGGSENYSIPDVLMNEIKAFPEVKQIYRRYGLVNFTSSILKEQAVSEVEEIGAVYEKENGVESSRYKINCSLQGYDDETMKIVGDYLSSGKADMASINTENGVFIIEKNILVNTKTERKYYGKLTNLKVGDFLEVGEAEKKTKLKVMGTLKVSPINFYGDESRLKLITTENVAAKLLKEEPEAIKDSEKANKVISLMIKIKDTKKDKEIVKKLDGLLNQYPQVRVTNDIDQNRQGKTGVLMVQILLYGFVVVISLIGSVNIFNTHTTNIILRRRELATLKAVGMGQKNLRKMIVLEGMIYGVAGIFYGSIIGTGFSYWIYKGISDAREQAWAVPIQAIIISSVAVLLVSYLSVLAPLSRINKDNLIETIRDDY